jgi:hypothetical protein
MAIKNKNISFQTVALQQGQVLQDIIDTALLIAKKDILKDESDKTKFSEINTG